MRGRLAAIILMLLLLLPALTVGQKRQRPSSCIDCHGGREGSLAEPVQAWRGSVHAANGISCGGCHGGDSTLRGMEAMSPEKGFRGVPQEEEIPQFCGRCHPGVEEDYRRSAHGRALGAGGPQCVTCHGSHAVERASVGLINRGNCTKCHGFGRAAAIRNALAATDKEIAGLNRELRQLHRVGIAVEELRGKLFSARNIFHRLFHTVDIERVRSRTGEIQSRLAEIRERFDRIEKRLSRRRQAGAVIVGLLALVTGLFAYLRHTYKGEEGGKR